MPLSVYIWRGLFIRHRRRAQSTGHPEPAARVRALRGRDRARAAAVAALRLQAPARAARGGLRGITHRRTAPPLSIETRAADGARRLARPLPSLLVEAHRCSGATPGQNGEGALRQSQRKEENMNIREPHTPGAAAGAEIRKDGETWTLVLVRDFRHPPATVWQRSEERRVGKECRSRWSRGDGTEKERG